MNDTTSPVALPGFDYHGVDVKGVTISCAVGGSGPPLLLLHGYPENHIIWRAVAPALAEDHTVVAADLRGYGNSDKPAPDAAGLEYSKRSMARDQLGLMYELGFGQFQLVSHDRGARVAHRLVLDEPGVVSRLAVLDIVPTRHALHTVTTATAAANYLWFFLAAGGGVPEHLIGSDPDFWVRAVVGQLIGPDASFEPEAMADYIRCFRDPAMVAGSCADYRSALSVDLDHDDETFAAGQKIQCPVLVLWGSQGAVAGTDPLTIWRDYATDVRGSAVPTGHFIAEEAPDLVIAALQDFLD
jgi:haloacetate dehalogenase